MLDVNNNKTSNVMLNFLATKVFTYSKNALLLIKGPSSFSVQVPARILLLLLHHHPQ
jgi:hypothetical protein